MEPVVERIALLGAGGAVWVDGRQQRRVPGGDGLQHDPRDSGDGRPLGARLRPHPHALLDAAHPAGLPTAHARRLPQVRVYRLEWSNISAH